MQKVQRLLRFYNGNLVPQIGLGTYNLKGQECLEAVTYALQIGYQHFDTALFYRNGGEISEAIKNTKTPRDRVFITSKLSSAEYGYKKTLSTCEKMLNELGVDYIDCLLLLWPGAGNYKPDDQKHALLRVESYKALEELYNVGKVKNLGVSNFLVHHLQHLLQNVNVKPVLNQIEIHPLCWNKETIEFCKQNRILIQAYAPMAKQDPKLLNNNLIKELSEKYNKTVQQIVLRWSFQKHFLLIPKSKQFQHLKQNLEVIEFQLSKEDMEQIDQLNINFHTCWDPSKILV